MMMGDKKYSDWLKIDLHIHTDWSKKTKEGDYKGIFSVTTLKQRLKENNVKIFSLTDHNIINIDAYKEYYSCYDPTQDPLLLLGVELDILVDNGTVAKTYHSLLIFNYSSVDKAEEIYKRLEEIYTKKGIEPKKRNLVIDDVVSLFPEDDFFFIPHAGNTKSIVDAYKPGNVADAQKMVLLMQSAFEKVPEKAKQRYNEGFDKTLHEAFQNKNDNAYIEFSDNHNIEKYPCTNKGDDGTIHEFYYVKGGKNFETLRLAFIDPQSRIKSDTELIQQNKLSNYIEKIKISSNGNLIDNEITLSPHLNVLIGGRSSGKSLMMSILGEKIDSLEIDKAKYSKVKYDNIQIKSKLDADYLASTSISKDELIFIKQGDIVKYFEENKLEDLAKESNKQNDYQSAKDKFKEHKRSLDGILDSIITNYNLVRESDIGQRFVLHHATIERILNSNYIFKLDIQNLQLKFDLTDKLAVSKEILENLVSNTAEFKDNELFEFIEDETELIGQFISLLKIKQELLEKKELANLNKLSFLSSINTLLRDKNQLLNADAQNKVEANSMRQKLISTIDNKFAKLYTLKKSCIELDNFDYSFNQIMEISTGVKLVLEVDTTDDLNKLIIDSINLGDSTSTSYINFIGLLKGLKNFKNFNDNKTESLRKKIGKQLEEIVGKLNNPKDYLDYDGGNTSKNNSPGFNSEKYLEIILRNPKTKLILIDQPEDNLGNRFIAENLVRIIREIKFEKQVILVTHNPSIVVYGDAENVIIAENNENKISYKQVVLENEDSQKEICKILDGGEYIFNMRSRKYNIQKILKTN